MLAQCFEADVPKPCAEFAQLLGVLRPADEHGCLGIAEEICDLRGGIGGVERQKDRAGADGCEIEHEGFRTLLDLYRHAVAGLDPQMNQRVCLSCGDRPKIVIGPDAAGRRL